MSEFRIAEAAWPADTADISALFREYQSYVATLGYDLGFQGFDAEVAELPGKYARPDGLMLIARHATDAAGCVAFRPLDRRRCEMKRLFVRPAYRGSRLGERLCRELIERARSQSYEAMRLDTGARMHSARELYRTLGFTPIAPYYENPYPDMEYFELLLSGPLPRTT